MKHIIIFLAILLSVHCELKEVTFADDKIKLYELADKDAISIDKEVSSLINVELIEEGEVYHQISYFDSNSKRSEIAFIEASTVALSTKNEAKQSSKLKKIEIEKTLLSSLKKKMGIKNTKGINVFLDNLPRTYQQHAIERHETEQTLKNTSTQVKNTEQNIREVAAQNSQLNQKNSEATKKNGKLDKENKELEENIKGNTAKIDDLKVALSVISDEKKKEVKVAQEKRFTWAAIAAVVALVLGFVLNR